MVQPLGQGKLREYTWKEVGEQIQKMAGYLVSLNLAPGSHIALISKNCAEWIMADLAIWMAGHVSIPLYPTLTSDSVRKIMEHSEARHVFIGKLDDWEEMSGGLPKGVHRIAFEMAPAAARATADALWEKIMSSQVPLDEWAERRDDEVATIIYTSGTTGMPKGVMHSFGALKAVGNRATFAYSMSDEDRVVSYLPLAHVAERVAVELGFLFVGMTVYFAESLQTFGEDIKRARPTVFFAVPRIWNKFYQKASEHVPPEKLRRMLAVPILGLFVRRKVLAAMGLDKCRIALSGAAALSQELINWFKALGLEILEVYGMTENLAWSHTTPEGGQRIGWVGKPNDAVECRLGGNGEIQVKSPGSMLGYFKEEQMSRDAFADDVWLRTGDVGVIDEDGYLRITGRVKEIYKTEKGKYVAPAPIETKLVTAPGIEQACVMGEGLPQSIALVDLGEEERAALEQDAAGTRSRLEAAFAAHLKETNAHLDPHERLDALVVVKAPWTIESGVLTPTLKVKRSKLEEQYAGRLAAWGQQGGVIWE
jgi:long-subunit acyl-CoA synthetase (AMP-forming)